MRALGLVKVNPVFEALPHLVPSFESVQMNTFVLQGSPEAFNHDIVHPSTLAVHGDSDIGGLEGAGKIITGEQASLVCIEDLGLAIAIQRFFESLDTEVCLHGAG